MYVCMYVRMYTCVRMYVYFNEWSSNMCLYFNECMYVCAHVCMYVRTYVCVHACMYICMYVCMYVYMYASLTFRRFARLM